MQHAQWFNTQSARKGKRVEVVKNGIKTFEWIDLPEAESVKPEPAEKPVTPLHAKKRVNTDKSNKFYKDDCSICGKETWHFKMDVDKSARCCSCPDPALEKAKQTLANGDGIIVTAQLMPTCEAPTEKQIAVMNKLDESLWPETAIRRTRVYADDLDLGITNPKVSTPVDVDKLVCSFCGVPIQKIHSTTEKRPKLRKVIEAVKEGDTVVDIQDKVIVSAQTVHACPRCVDRIKKPVVVRKV